MKRFARVVAALVVAQTALVGVYWLIEQRRAADERSGGGLGTAAPERIDIPLPRLGLRARDGRRVEIAELRRPTLVHFWATWCPPCREELPSLLALPETHAVDVVAVALDREWAAVDRFLSGGDTLAVVLGDAEEAERTLGVRHLPVTFLVAPGGSVRLRFDGARDWAAPRFVEPWIEVGVPNPKGGHR